VQKDAETGVEWPTLALVVVCYSVWAFATTWLATLSLPLAILVLTLAITLHSSLQHEVLHGHPFARRLVNEALVFLPLGLVYPYGRFRDLHLAHHRDEHLTDPYDDPETNFLDPAVWAGLSRLRRQLLIANNSLLGRMLIGPMLTVWCFTRGEIAAMAQGDHAVRRAWFLHGLGVVPVIAWVWLAPVPGWAYAVACYAGLSILKVRTFLEHRAHELARGRSVIVEDRGLLSLLFLNNNFHAVHHARPRVAWYRLPQVYAESRPDWLKRNEGYLYRSYAEVFRRHFFRPKDPVPHPLRPHTAPAPVAQDAGDMRVPAA
jgi:fatty acid desaturase